MKNIAVITLLLLILAVTPIPFSQLDSQPESEITLSSITLNDPIEIQSNADFDTQGWPGTGEEGSPFVIENLEIRNDDFWYLFINYNVFRQEII